MRDHLSQKPCLKSQSGGNVDFGIQSVENGQSPKKDRKMAEESTTPATIVVENGPVNAPERHKRNASRRQNSTAESARATSEEAALKTVAKPRRYTDQEKLEKLQLIETRVTAGASTLKDAVKWAGISEQTYYNWKSRMKPGVQTVDEPDFTGDEFAALVQLEAENQRLRKLLAEKLRAENFELRKRLGLG